MSIQSSSRPNSFFVLLPALTEARSPCTAAIRCSSLKHKATVKVWRIALLAAAPSASSVRPPPPPQASPGPIGGCRYCSCLLPQTASPRRRDSAQLNPLRRILTKHGEELGKRWGINDSYMRHLPLSTSPITTATMRTTIQLHEVSRDA